MSDFFDAAARVRGRVEPALPSIKTLDSAGTDKLLEDFYSIGMHDHLIAKLASHYKVSHRELMDLLVSRQGIFLHLMTDYNKVGSPEQLQELLRNQNTKVQEFVDHVYAMSRRMDELVETSAAVQARVLTALTRAQDRIKAHLPKQS